MGFGIQNPMFPWHSTSSSAPQPGEQHFSSTPRGGGEVRSPSGALQRQGLNVLSQQLCWGCLAQGTHGVQPLSRPLLRCRMGTGSSSSDDPAAQGGAALHGVSVACHTISLTCVSIVFCKSASLGVFTLQQGWACASICHSRPNFSVGETNYL